MRATASSLPEAHSKIHLEWRTIQFSRTEAGSERCRSFLRWGGGFYSAPPVRQLLFHFAVSFFSSVVSAAVSRAEASGHRGLQRGSALWRVAFANASVATFRFDDTWRDRLSPSASQSTVVVCAVEVRASWSTAASPSSDSSEFFFSEFPLVRAEPFQTGSSPDGRPRFSTM